MSLRREFDEIARSGLAGALVMLLMLALASGAVWAGIALSRAILDGAAR